MYKQVQSLYQNWIVRFRREWKGKYRYRPYLINPDGKEPETLPQDEIEFISVYLGHMMIDGNSQENLQRIKRFLSMQGAVNKGADLEIRFLLGNPLEVYVFVEDVTDIDFADTSGITDFQAMQVYLRNGEIWTQESIAEFVKNLRIDFAFDGLHPDVLYKFEDSLLEIECKVE
jgi:hypothetical protein